MVACRFFQQGRCAYGDKCRFEHGGAARSSGDAAMGNAFNQSTLGGPSGSTPNKPKNAASLAFNAEHLQKDWTTGAEKPMWPLSAYGPAKYEPIYVTGIDVSPEEMRVKAYEAKASGQLDQYISHETSLSQQANDIYADRVKDFHETFKHIVAGDTFGPNGPSNPPPSYSTVANGTMGSQGGSVFGAAQGSNMPGGAFGGESSAFGGVTSAFGQPQATTSAFGNNAAPSTFGTSAFGNTPATSAFSQPTVPTQTSAFGLTGFGASSTKPAVSAFGAAPSSSGGGFAAFGNKPSGFAGAGSAFGQSSFGTPQSAFGQPSQPSATGFGQTGFGQSGFGTTAPSSAFATQSNNTHSGFGALSQPTAANQPTSIFGQPPASSTLSQPVQPTSAFGQPSQPTSAFSQPSQSASVFSQPQQSVFSQPQPSAFSQPAQPASAFGRVMPPTSAFGQPSQPASAFSAFGLQASSNATPFGAAAPASHKPDPFAPLLPPNYLESLPAKVKEAFGREDDFEWGNIPEWIPPMEMR